MSVRLCLLILVSLASVNDVICDEPQGQYWWGDTGGAPITYPIVLSCRGENDANMYMIGFNQRLIVKVLNIDSLMKMVDSESDIILVLDNVRLNGIRAYNVNTWTGEVYFRLSMNDYSGVNQQAWSMVLGSPGSFSKMVSVSVASALSGRSLPTVVNKRHNINSGVILEAKKQQGYALMLMLVSPARLSVALGITLLLCLLFWWAISKTDMLRVSTMQKFNTPDEKPPYSLALAQMAFWYVLIVASSIYLWVFTDIFVPFSNSVLGILGISTVTGITGMTIDSRCEKQSMEKGSQPYQPSKNLLRDITNDATGSPAVQRVMILVWTMLFGAYYLFDVYRSVSIPEIDESMLILMGLTSSAYLGGKVIDPGTAR
ncbi:MAG: hypothetical protein HYX66_04345 [Ignavibacteria bacterium]|nr:hypothetical protein [Ignavibacteria bacterium]